VPDAERTAIYLVVEFDWPSPFEPEYGQRAKELHSSVQGHEWIKKVLAASGGLGSGQSSNWVFWLENSAALDRLFSDRENQAGKAYRSFFSTMDNVSDKIREEVRFI